MIIRAFVTITGKLLRGFEPVYPEHLHIDLRTFCNTFPYHIIFDEQVNENTSVRIYVTVGRRRLR